MRHSSAAGNALWMIFGRLAQSGLSLLVGILTARYLGPADYGLIHYAAGLTGFFAAFCTLGLPSILVKELTVHPEETGEILGTAMVMQCVSSLASGAVIMGLVGHLERGNAPLLLVAAFSCMAMVLRFFDSFHCFFQAKQRSKVTAAVLLAAHGAAMAYKAALLVLGKNVAWFAFGAVLEQLWAGGLLVLAYWREQMGRLAISRETALRLWRESHHFILPGLMVAVYAQTDRVMLTRMLGEAVTGCYSAAVTLCGSWCFVLSALIDAMYPEIAAADREDAAEFDRKNRQLYAMVFYLSAGAAVLLACFGEPLVCMIYGEAYRSAAGPLRILGWYTAFSYLGVARNVWVVCRGAQKDLVWIYAAAALANVWLNLVLIPRWGSAGAAAASLAAQVISGVIAPCCFSGLRGNVRLMLEGILLKNLWNREKTP